MFKYLRSKAMDAMNAERLRPYHSSALSQVIENVSDYQSSDDGYDYNVVDDAPEAQSTKPKDLATVRLGQTPLNDSAGR